jgi:hypothetical protein
LQLVQYSKYVNNFMPDKGEDDNQTELDNLFETDADFERDVEEKQ